MTNANAVEPKKPKKSALSFLLWWKIDPAEIEKEITQYNTLKVWQSARGTSTLFCVFTIVATVLLGEFLLHLSTSAIAVEVIIWAPLAIFMYRGHRWAFMVGMALWTIEKAMLIYSMFTGDTPTPGAQPFFQIVWWAIYMHAFFLAYKVESVRRLPIVEVKTA